MNVPTKAPMRDEPPATPIALKGAPGSPYTRKMLALLRYRRIPYRYLIGSRAAPPGLPSPKVELLPTFYLPDADGQLQAVVDSTPIIRRLEREIDGRSVLPPDPAIRFIDELLEDYGDEWLTKAMFHYRWHYAADIARSASILPRWRGITAPETEVARASADFSQRQISRLYVVGSNAVTAPVIESAYERFLALMESHLRVSPFLMGDRPGASDFAVFGQLTQLTHFDPTPMAIAVERAPRVFAWVDLLEDLSGLEPAPAQWITREAFPGTLRALLAELARGYVPVMLANARAARAGSDRVETEVDGQAWVQQTFPYQAKCVGWLRESFARLDAEARDWVLRLLDESGCAGLLTEAV
jgi:glutathione S-transferase